MNSNRPEYVPGEGPDNASIMLIGQNPGREEAKQRKPFVGRAGKYLDSVLKKYGIDRGGIYITAMVKQTTPHNRRPTEKEIKTWMPYLLQEIEIIKPKTIILMGTVAWKTPRLKGIEYIETYHPAAAMRFPKIRDRFEKDIKELRERHLF